jgi:hypothetical protein
MRARGATVGPQTFALAAICAVAALAFMPTLSSAYSPEHYCEGIYLQPQFVCGSANAHSGDMYVDIQTDHTGCAAVGQGYGPSQRPAQGYFTVVIACTSGSGTSGGVFHNSGGPSGNLFHGAVYDPNQTTANYIYEAHLSQR